MSHQPDVLQIRLPSWMSSFTASRPSHLATVEDRMSLVIDAARANILNQTGGPFAAAVFESDSGKLVSLGVNLVTTQGLSILHAEMVAFAFAQRALGSYDLGAAGLPDHELVASAEPCAMCFGAIPWSGVKKVIMGARDSDVRAIGFDEGPKIPDWRESLEKRGISTICDVGRPAAANVLSDYAKAGGKIYNSRKSDQRSDAGVR